MPLEVVIALPCIGSQSHRALSPLSRTASTSGGRLVATFPAPMRAMNARRPGSALGLSARASAIASSGVLFGPSFTPMGLPIPRKNSMCAPSRWRVRSPTHGMWVERS